MRNIELPYLFTAATMIWVMIHSTGREKFPTFSHISTGTRTARHAFTWGLSIAGLFFALLMYGWFIPYFSLGITFQILTVFIVVSHVLTGFFPVEAKHLGKLHIVFGVILAISMFILLSALTLTTSIPVSIRIVDGTIASCMVLLAVSTRWTLKDPKELLRHEYVFFGLWHMAILITTYIA